jgi:hypothetical protein
MREWERKYYAIHLNLMGIFLGSIYFVPDGLATRVAVEAHSMKN